MKKGEPEIIADLELLTDDELRSVVGKSNEILIVRDKKRKEEAVARARAIMEEAGLSFPAERIPAKRGRKKAS